MLKYRTYEKGVWVNLSALTRRLGRFEATPLT